MTLGPQFDKERQEREEYFNKRMESWDDAQRQAHFSLQDRIRSVRQSPSALVVPTPSFDPGGPINARIAKRGKVLPGEGSSLIQGSKCNDCHGTSARHAAEERSVELWTGYAESGDDEGIWREHTWTRQGGTVFEPTVPRTAYFGVKLKGRARQRFIEENS